MRVWGGGGVGGGGDTRAIGYSSSVLCIVLLAYDISALNDI